MMGIDFAFIFCLYLAPSDAIAVCPPPPLVHEACWSVTNYWPYTEIDGQWVLMDGFRGQCDSDCSHTAIMADVTPEMAGLAAAVPISLIDKTLYLPGFGDIWAWDTFGKKAYREGVFWHYSYDTWVIGVDVFTPQPIHYLECNGEIR